MNRKNDDRIIVTAASSSYGPSLLALLGSLNLNWPNHPPVLVYDIGLDDGTLKILQENNVDVKKIPPFCPHWRRNFTWKIWCLNDAPAQNVLWLDAGVIVLEPIDELFEAIDGMGYFLVPNYHLLDWEASDAACEGCGVSPEFRFGKPTLAGTLMGFRKQGEILNLLKEALLVALTEKHIVATQPSHRHDQAIISLLMYKHFKHVLMSDGIFYMGWRSPKQTHRQKVWVHRRKILVQDRDHFIAHITQPGEPYMPKDPADHKLPSSISTILWMKNIYYWFRSSLLKRLFSKNVEDATHEKVIPDGVKD